MTPTYILLHILKVSLVLLNINENVEEGGLLKMLNAGIQYYCRLKINSTIIFFVLSSLSYITISNYDDIQQFKSVDRYLDLWLQL